MTVDTVSSTAATFHRERFKRYIKEGFSVVDAEEAADMDLLEWSKPLDFPANPNKNAWFDADDDQFKDS